MTMHITANQAIGTTPATDAASALTQGRWVGFGLLVSFALGMFTNFYLQPKLFSDGGFMVQAGQQPWLVASIAVLALLGGLITLAIATTIRRRTAAQAPVLSLSYLMLVTASFALTQVEHSVLMTMRPISEAFLAAGSEAGASFDMLKLLLSGLRNGIHFPDKLVGGVSVFVMFFLLKNSRLIPAPLALAGMVAAVCQMSAILRVLFGFDMIYAMLAPIALVFPATGVRLLVKGFAPTAAGTPNR